MDLKALFSLEYARALPEGSREKALASLSIKSIWHAIFDYAPNVLSLSQYKDGKDIFELFLEWAHQKKLKMDWTLHIYLLDWLCSHPQWEKNINEKIKKELLLASVTRWSMNGMDHILVKGMMLVSQRLSGIAAGIWKSTQADQSGKIIFFKIPKHVFPQLDSYAITQNEVWGESIKWFSI
jgi:hypothetical protein